MSNRKSALIIVPLLAVTLTIAGCATDASKKRTGIGAAGGAGLGAAIGAIFGGSDRGKNAAIGGAAGALAGSAVGYYMDRQYDRLQKELAQHSDDDDLSLTKMEGDALRIGIASDFSFAFDSADLDSDGKGIFRTIGNILQNYDKTAIHVVGFTDSVGQAEYNKQLSKRRAKSVADFLEENGVDAKRIQTWGRGEDEPVASNDTSDGQARNRRVEIVIKPIVEDDESEAFSEPPNLGNR